MRKVSPIRTPEAKPRKARKSTRVELRITPASKQMIDRAVSISGLTPGDLAYEAARRVVEDHERFLLRDEDREVFLRAMMNPPKPNAALIRAFKRHRAATR
jgi:uncharacterized protein (DUF1778 family)